MTVKRLLSVILSVMMIVASMVSVSATTSAATIDTVAINVFDVTVTVNVPTEITGTMTAQIVDEAETDLFAIGSQSVKTDDNTYTISLTMPKSAPTGSYIVRIGNNVAAVEETFDYTNIVSLAVFYNGFIENQSDAAALETYLKGVASSPVDLTGYKGLVSAELQDLATEQLATASGLQSVAIVDPANPTAAELAAAEAAAPGNNAIFVPLFNDAMEVAEIMDVAEADWEAMVAELFGSTDFDDYYYGVATAPVLNVADVYDCYKTEIAAVDTLAEFTKAETGKAFDRATLAYIEKNIDVDYLKDAFLYTEAKGSITVDMTNINTLIANEADGELWKAVYLATNADAAAIVTITENTAYNMANPGGGGGGGAGGADPIDKPTTPATPGAMIDKPTAAVTFNDLGSAEWAREAVEALAARGVLNGKTAGIFAPNDNVTREEITKIITSAFGLVQDDAECAFTDVAADRWSYVYVASASRLGIVNGYGADFGPANKTTREDMAVMIYRVLKLMNINVSGTATNFSDASSISPYACDAVKALTSAGIINGMGDGTFAPKAYVTRAQIAKVAYELLNLAGGNQ